MQGQYNLNVSYHVEPEYWTFYLKIQIDGFKTLRSMTYELPKRLKVFSWVIEDIPVYIITDTLPYVEVRWGGVAVGLNAKEIVNIQSALDYIRIHKP